MVCTIKSSALHCTTLRTLFINALLQCCKDCAHRNLHAVQSKCARWSSVFVPCLQIRVGRFDSGSRLHLILHAVPHSLQFCSATATQTPLAHNSHSRRHKQRCALWFTLWNAVSGKNGLRYPIDKHELAKLIQRLYKSQATLRDCDFELILGRESHTIFQVHKELPVRFFNDKFVGLLVFANSAEDRSEQSRTL